jgi:hypothetical protein
MTASERKDVLVVLHRSDGSAPTRDEQRLRLPVGAGFSDLLRELERESPTMYEEVRDRILRSAGRVLAYGKDDDLLPSLTRQLAEGGPVIFPAEEEARGLN